MSERGVGGSERRIGWALDGLGAEIGSAHVVSHLDQHWEPAVVDFR